MKMKWDYVNEENNSLSDDFKKEYIIDIKGKEAIRAEGLKVLAHKKGIKKLNSTIVQYPSDSNIP